MQHTWELQKLPPNKSSAEKFEPAEAIFNTTRTVRQQEVGLGCSHLAANVMDLCLFIADDDMPAEL